jgi:hypothetical protein
LGGARGADVGAGAAVYAGGGVHNELAVALGDSVAGAFAFAGSAADAIIVDKICHNKTSII